MSIINRILNIMVAVLTILLAVVSMVWVEGGYVVMYLYFGIAAFITGVRYIVYYFIYARYMVDGKNIIVRGMIALDLGICVGMLISSPTEILMLFFIIYLMLDAVIAFLRAGEAYKLKNKSWKYKALLCGFHLIFVVLGLCNIHSVQVVMIVFGVKLILTSIKRIHISLIKHSFEYIQ